MGLGCHHPRSPPASTHHLPVQKLITITFSHINITLMNFRTASITRHMFRIQGLGFKVPFFWGALFHAQKHLQFQVRGNDRRLLAISHVYTDPYSKPKPD